MAVGPHVRGHAALMNATFATCGSESARNGQALGLTVVPEAWVLLPSAPRRQVPPPMAGRHAALVRTSFTRLPAGALCAPGECDEPEGAEGDMDAAPITPGIELPKPPKKVDIVPLSETNGAVSAEDLESDGRRARKNRPPPKDVFGGPATQTLVDVADGAPAISGACPLQAALLLPTLLQCRRTPATRSRLRSASFF
mmetsp:Transcript_75907/g.210701  ORF Transcript_75907/g.210701 Transcript_75907/m.210701 type:complete len:198 (-) Transcript_75907:236-829(-)